MLILFLFSGLNSAYGQKKACLVDMESIKGTYTGGCKKGLADGYGKAVGLDTYEGEFKKGLPHGEGIYTWRSGKKFEGKFQNGRMHGKGAVTQNINGADSLTTGFWRQDAYVGMEFLPDVGIVSRRNVDRIAISQEPGNGGRIRIRFIRMGVKNGAITDLQVTADTGIQQLSVGEMYIDHALFPFNTIITYRTPNKFNTAILDVRVELNVNFDGNWLITLYN